MVQDMSQPKGEPRRSSKELLRTLSSQELVDCLQALFPDRLPMVVVDQSSLGRLIGQQEVIRCIRQAIEEGSKYSMLNLPK